MSISRISNGVRKRRQFSKRKTRDRFRISVEGAIQTGTFRASADKVTVKEAAEAYIVELKARLARGEITRRHVEMVEGRVWNYVCPDPTRAAKQKRGSRRAKPFSDGVGGVKLSQLTPPTVKRFAGKLRDAGVSVATTRKIVAPSTPSWNMQSPKIWSRSMQRGAFESRDGVTKVPRRSCRRPRKP